MRKITNTSGEPSMNKKPALLILTLAALVALSCTSKGKKDTKDKGAVFKNGIVEIYYSSGELRSRGSYILTKEAEEAQKAAAKDKKAKKPKLTLKDIVKNGMWTNYYKKRISKKNHPVNSKTTKRKDSGQHGIPRVPKKLPEPTRLT